MHNGCVLNGGVGSGKTITSLMYYWHNERPRDIYVITTAKKRDDLDWQKDAAKLGIGRSEDATTAGTITVDSWNNIGRYSDVRDGFFIFDEQRLVGSGAWVKAFLRIAKANRWILLSATPGDTWMDYCPVFIANGFYKNRTDFIRSHVVYNNFSKFPKIDRYIDTGILQKHRTAVLVLMPYRRSTTRHINTTPVAFDAASFGRVKDERWHIFEDRPIKDVGELFIVMRKLVNSSPARLEKVLELHQKHPKLIVFYNHNHELESLRTLAERCEGTAVAEWNGHKHQDIPKTEKWIYLVQYTAGAEGWNCIETDAMIFYSLNYSYKIWEQALGRIDRLNTPFKDLYYYVFRSNSFIDGAIWKSLMGKKNFNEKDLGLEW